MPPTAALRANRPSIGRQGFTIASVAGLYALLALAFRGLASEPGPVQALVPAAGAALACVLVFGRLGLAGVALGAFAVEALLYTRHRGPPLAAVLLAVAPPVQAWLAARWTQRHADQPHSLSEPRDIAVFVAAAVLASAVVATATLAALGLRSGGELSVLDASGLWVWLLAWAGQALGSLLGAPILLSFIGQPAAEWAPRRLVIGITLGALLLLLVLGTLQVMRLDRERIESDFEREAQHAAEALDFTLQRPLLALEAMRSVFVASGEVSRTDMRRAAESWVAPPTHIQALGWSLRLPRNGFAEQETQARAEGLAGYTVRDRPPGAPPGTEPVVIRYIEPLVSNAGALGVNAMSVPAAREAIERSVRSDQPAATAGFRLSQDPEDSRQTGIVVYRAIYAGTPTSEAARQRAARGVVFVTLRMDDLLAASLARVPPSMVVCIIDPLGEGRPQRLAGPLGCDTQPARLQRDHVIRFVDRAWTLRLSGRDGALFADRSGNMVVLSGVGLLVAAMLGALLLGMTGRTRRIEAAVAERTAALYEEVSERQQAEAAMRESEQRFRNIFNNVPIGVVYTDLSGRLQHVNPQFSTLTGHPAEALLRMNLFDLLLADDAEPPQHLLERLLGGDEAMVRGQHRVPRQDGQTVWVQATLTLLRDADGEPRRLVGVMEDITEHLRLVEAERARDQAESANQAKSEFLSRMSHELRTPLNAMLGFAQLLELDQRHPLAPGQRPWVAQIQQAGWHLLDMINDVLDLSRIESGNMRLTLQNLDLDALVEASLALVARDAARRGIRVRREAPNGTVAVVGDVTRIKQILINLLSNAVKYNTDGGEIHITMQQRGTQVSLVVTDTGLGMTDEQMAELFQPFNRLGRERTSLEGTGIGLVISQRLAELMGGTLHAESRAGAGSSFVLTLPMAPDADTVRAEIDPADLPGSSYHRRVVHYVEDNETNIEVMRGILAQRPQVQMAVSMTGAEALAALRAAPPDVILLDMNLPDIDGLELLKLLKADPVTAGTAVVVVSADALAGQIDAALDAGALRYVTKPVSVSEVLQVIDELLHAAESRYL